MIIIAWNMGGLGSSNKRRELRNLVHRYKVDFIIVSETMIDSFWLPLLRSIGGGRLNSWEYLSSQGLARGILIGWNDSF